MEIEALQKHVWDRPFPMGFIFLNSLEYKKTEIKSILSFLSIPIPILTTIIPFKRKKKRKEFPLVLINIKKW